MSRMQFILLLTIILFLSLAAPQSYAQKILSGTINVDAVLDTIGGRIYWVTNHVTVASGATLTIDPGVVLKFQPNINLTINDGTLMAVGGASLDSLIYFTSITDDNAPAPLGDDTNGDGGATAPNNQDWGAIIFNDATVDTSTLKHCIIRYGGYQNTGNIVCNDASPTFEYCDIFAAYYGVRCDGGSKPILRNTSINAMTDVPVAIEITADPVFDNLAFESVSDNGFDAIGILGGTLYGPNVLRIRSATLGATPIDNLVYILLADVTIADGGSLTIQPGVVVKPKGSVDVRVEGTLTMDGTSDPDSQIVFTSFKDDNYGNPSDTNNDGSITSPAAGDWGYISFNSGSSGSVSWAVTKFGGYSSWGIIRAIDSSPTISNCVISDTYYGIMQEGLAGSSIQDNTISNCIYTPIFMSVSADPSFSGNTFTNNTITALGIISETISVNSVLRVQNVAGYDNITYWLSHNLTIAAGANLRIEPGVVVKIQNGSYGSGWYARMIFVDGSLTADATIDSGIVFTSLPDDNVGNPLDTEGNGSITTPSAADWGYIKFSSTSVDSLCKLDYCTVSYGGYYLMDYYKGTVWCNNASPTITNCQFNANMTGIRIDGSSSPLIQDNDFSNHTYIPFATSVVSSPVFGGNTFNQNATHAVGILGETLSQDAVLERIEVGGPPQFAEYFPYYHTGALTIGSGSVLTVEPGVVVKTSAGRPIIVNGGLEMVGTSDPDSIIVYTSITDDSYGGDSNVDGGTTSPSAGNWGGILFNSTTIDTASILEHCLFRFGGSSGVVELQSASPTIRNCEFEINTWGLWIQNLSDPIVEDNLFRLTDYTPISKSVLANPTFSGNTFDNNAYDALGLIGETIAQDLTITKWDIAGYTNITRILVNNPLTINTGTRLIIESGVVLKLGGYIGEPFYYCFPGYIDVNGAMEADGTPGEPIVFTSIFDDDYGNPSDTNNDGSLTEPGGSGYYPDWGFIRFNDVSTDSLNVLEYCIMRYGGGGTSPFGGGGTQVVGIVSASPTISHCTIENNNVSNAHHGIKITGNSAPSIDSCTFAGCSLTPVAMSLLSDPSFSGNQFLASNTFNALGIVGETLAQEALWKRRNVAQTENIPYVLLNNLTVGLSAILQIQPGVVIKPRGNIKITVKRGLIAEGKADPESLIVFTSTTDDFYGGDTNNDSTDTDGSSNRWYYIQIDNEAIDDSTRFDYCVFRYATNSSSYGALNVTNANPQINHCIFTQNGIGINYNGAAGDSTKGRVENSDFFDNTYYGIKNTNMSYTVWAQSNWWGDDTGPNDPSDDTGSGGFYNPGGLGDPVTDMVDYSNWKTTGVQNYLLGDVSLNNEIRAYDASLILQHLALLITLTGQQQTVGDVTCNGSLSTLDASYVLRYVAGLISSFPCALDSIPTAPPLFNDKDLYPGLESGDFYVRIPAFALEAGGSITLPIEVGGSGELLGQEYRIAFDPEQLVIEDVQLTEVTKGAVLVWNVVDGKELRIALASADLLPIETAVEIKLEAQCRLTNNEAIPFAFTLARLNEQDLTDKAESEGGKASGPNLPTSFRLDQNHPNPFNPNTTISYAIPAYAGKSIYVTLKIYDVSGRLVTTLVDKDEHPGIQSVTWDGRDKRGNLVGSGVYFYRIEAGSFTSTKKMVLIR